MLPAIKVLKPHAPIADRNNQVQCQPRNLGMPWQIRYISISTNREVDGGSEQLLVLECILVPSAVGHLRRLRVLSALRQARLHSQNALHLNNLLLQYPHNTTDQTPIFWCHLLLRPLWTVSSPPIRQVLNCTGRTVSPQQSTAEAVEQLIPPWPDSSSRSSIPSLA